MVARQGSGPCIRLLLVASASRLSASHAKCIVQAASNISPKMNGDQQEAQAAQHLAAAHNAGSKARAVEPLLARIQPHVAPLAGVHILCAKLLGTAANP